ncbi:MAG: 3-oxoacyl-ACP reductase [Streptococcaceae bacterium]|jgi:3-oxoacyl-[acyl-carrier protein] reductase|nr:3-oxoacyl-ACP reductase [Streptococcaceae bacterium]
MSEFLGKRVLVTGGASGIGLSQAKAFLKAGAQVFVVDKRLMSKKEKLDQNYGSSFSFLQADISDISQVKKLKKEIKTIDILLNTAGILDAYATIEEITFESWNKVFATNVSSQFLLVKVFLPLMLKKGSGVIINMSSIAGLVAGGGGVAYTTSKHAIVGFTKQLALDYAKKGIKVYAIAPGAIKTSMNAADFAKDGKNACKIAKETPLGRWAKPCEVADLTLFLASKKANYMQGAIIPIDGGWMLK